MICRFLYTIKLLVDLHDCNNQRREGLRWKTDGWIIGWMEGGDEILCIQVYPLIYPTPKLGPYRFVAVLNSNSPEYTNWGL